MAHVHWLYDKRLGFFLIELVLEIVLVRWQHPRFGEEVKVILERFLHSSQVSCQVIFPSQCLHSWLTVDALVGSKLTNLLRLHAHIRPIEVPVRLHVLIELEVHLAAHSLDDIVARGMRAQYQLLVHLLLRRGFRRRRLGHIVVLIVRLDSLCLGLQLLLLMVVVVVLLAGGGRLTVVKIGVGLKRSCRLKSVLYLFDALGRVEIVHYAVLEGCGAARTNHTLPCRLLHATRWLIRYG